MCTCCAVSVYLLACICVGSSQTTSMWWTSIDGRGLSGDSAYHCGDENRGQCFCNSLFIGNEMYLLWWKVMT